MGHTSIFWGRGSEEPDSGLRGEVDRLVTHCWVPVDQLFNANRCLALRIWAFEGSEDWLRCILALIINSA